MTTLQVLPTQSVSISKLIEINIPQTHDTGDALAAAVEIMDAAYKAVVKAYGCHEYTYQTGRIQTTLAKRYMTYLKTGEVR